jgi:hypothetical protein
VNGTEFFPVSGICSRCGKPEHGSLSCDYAPGWPEPPKVTAVRLDPSAPGGPLDRIASALERLAAALEQNTENKP